MTTRNRGRGRGARKRGGARGCRRRRPGGCAPPATSDRHDGACPTVERPRAPPDAADQSGFGAADPDRVRRQRGAEGGRGSMSILYDHSARWRALVLGTSNKTELLLGYGTLYGDMASALNPIGDLYKTQVRTLAAHLGVPAEIVAKKPSADLWVGQTDEEELGFTYEGGDRLLYYVVDRRYELPALLELGFPTDFVHTVLRRVQSSQYKRRPPLIAKISVRTIDRD